MCNPDSGQVGQMEHQIMKGFRKGTDEMKSRKSSERYLEILFLGIIFVGLFLFFVIVHPPYIFTADDWTYIVQTRKAIPLLKCWNPTKVLPETLMPLVAEMGIRFFMPLNGDYIASMATAFALLTSVCYTIYFALFYRLARKQFGLSGGYGMIMGGFIVLMHFLPFMKNMTGNGYMYSSSNVTELFNYTIPALLNTVLVLVFTKNGSFVEKRVNLFIKSPKLSDGMWLLLIYLAICSNMFQSILLTAYISGTLLVDFIVELKNRKRLTWESMIQYGRERAVKLIINISWLCSLFLEAHGGRAKSLKESESLLGGVPACIRLFIKIVCELNPFFIATVILPVGMALFLVIEKRKNMEDLEKRYIRMLGQYLAGMIITVTYLTLLCAKAGSRYLGRDNVFSGILFYVLLITWISLLYMARRLPAMIICMPVAVYVLCFATVINVRSYYGICSADVIKAIGDDILNQVIEADRGGKDTMELYVPFYESADNFPFALYMGGRISNALYAHGIVDRKIEITVVPTERMNKKYHLK